jgi:hypothetical protein
MDRLSIYLTLAVGAMITGGLVTTVLVLGWYNWAAIGGAAALGMIVTWPASYAISRRIKRQDPDWDSEKTDQTKGLVPDPKAPEF